MDGMETEGACCAAQDTEQNPQIWTHCADVRIVPKG